MAVGPAPDRQETSPPVPSSIGSRGSIGSITLAIASGAAWGLCHGRVELPWLAAVALAPLVLLLGRRHPFWLGWLHGTAAWVVSLPWIVHTITTYGMVPGPLAALGLLALGAVLGIYRALFAWLAAPVWRRGGAWVYVALPALWVVAELARGRLLTGFPWNLAAYAWTEVPGALPLAAWIGAWGVSALVVATNIGMARAWSTRRWEPAAATLLVVATLLGVGARFAVPPSSGGRPLPVRIVQPDIPDRQIFDPAASEEDYQRLLAMTREVCRPGVLVLWPESASWPHEWQDDPRLEENVRALATAGCDVLLNSAFTRSGHTYNAVLLVGAPPRTPPLQMTAKRHLVPFGEYVPLERLLPFAGKIARFVGEFTPGHGVELLAWNGARIGVAVCYEIVFPGLVADLVRQGATLLVTVTNDGWYGDSAAPRQHLRAARFRAAEERRWVLRAALTGISAAIRPDGSLAGRLDLGRHGVLALDVEGIDSATPFARAPWLVPLLCLVVGAAAIVIARRGRGAASRSLERTSR